MTTFQIIVTTYFFVSGTILYGIIIYNNYPDKVPWYVYIVCLLAGGFILLPIIPVQWSTAREAKKKRDA